MGFKNIETQMILIIGPLPPPIGGVSIHVSRKILELSKIGFPYVFLNTKNTKYYILIKELFLRRVIHFHLSNVYFLFLCSFLGFILRKKYIFTIHGDLSRFKYFEQVLIRATFFFSAVPILLNKKSLNIGLKYNKNAVFISSFIPPELCIKESLTDILSSVSSKFEIIFCTNAYNLTYDKSGIEIYQILTLFELFLQLPNNLLIISDPSGVYFKKIQDKYIQIPENIIIIPFNHNFVEVLNKSDCFIRFTTTDGDSLSVREALYLNKMVIASNVVERPNGVILVNLDKTELFNVIQNLRLDLPKFSINSEDTVDKLVGLYSNIL